MKRRASEARGTVLAVPSLIARKRDGGALADAEIEALIAGAAAAVDALPVAILPIVTVGTAVALGVGVAGGVASGRNAPPPE